MTGALYVVTVAVVVALFVLRARPSRPEQPTFAMPEIVGVHVGSKVVSVAVTRGSGIVTLCTGEPFKVSDIGQVVTGLGVAAGTTVVAVVSGGTALLSAPYGFNSFSACSVAPNSGPGVLV